MLEVTGNIFHHWLTTPLSAIVIPTNGIVKVNGCLVMGKGLAKDIVDRYPGLDVTLGRYVSEGGNNCYIIKSDNAIISFPTKHHWRSNSDIGLINQSLDQLVDICKKNDIVKCYLPKVGCGNGNLSYGVVKPLLKSKLDNRFTVVI